MRQHLILKFALLTMCFAAISQIGQAQSYDLSGTVYASAFGGGFVQDMVGLHESSGTFQNLLPGLTRFQSMACGPNSSLIFARNERIDEDFLQQQIWRYNSDGSDPTFLFAYDTDFRFIHDMLFAPNGEMFFVTFFSTQNQVLGQGLWRYRNFLTTKTGVQEPELLVPREEFQYFPASAHISRLGGFLRTGPYAGDLLILDAPSQSFQPSGRVMRVISPDFIEMVEFIAPFADQVGQPFHPLALATNSEGNVFVSDFSNDRILMFDDEGNRIGELAELVTPNRMAIGPDDVLYVTNTEFLSDPDEILRGDLYLYDTISESSLGVIDASDPLFEVRVCAGEVVINVSDTDGDGVPDEEDLCPTFPGRPETNGC